MYLKIQEMKNLDLFDYVREQKKEKESPFRQEFLFSFVVFYFSRLSQALPEAPAAVLLPLLPVRYPDNPLPNGYTMS